MIKKCMRDAGSVDSKWEGVDVPESVAEKKEESERETSLSERETETERHTCRQRDRHTCRQIEGKRGHGRSEVN